MTITDRQPATGSPEAESETAFWLAISRVPYIGPARIERLLQTFGSLSVAWSALRRRAPRGAGAPVALGIARGAKPDRPGRGARAPRPIGDPRRPSRASVLPTTPCRNFRSPFNTLCPRRAICPPMTASVAIVGTRRATPYGRQAAERIAAELAQAGITVVSGLARGVDAVAHRAALEAGGRTIAVLGSGPDVIYPAEHRRLAEQILGVRGHPL